MPHYTRLKKGALPLLLVLAGVLPSSAAPALADGSVSQHSQRADADLICSSSDSRDCYQRVFQPTDEFQVVREGQELPSGLHVRLNIWTGQKEAKLNAPGRDEIPPELEGLPVDRAVVVVDPEQSDAPPPPPPGRAPAYEHVGKLKPPGSESQAFAAALQTLRDSARRDGALDKALDGLEELAHDMYYGAEVAADTDAVKALLCFMTCDEPPAADGVAPRDKQAASILAGALQNNPVALGAVARAWPELARHTCPGARAPLGETLHASVVPARNTAAGEPPQHSAARVRAKVSALSGLLRDGAIRGDFVRHGGMRALLAVLAAPDSRAWAGAQRRVAQLALNIFLDEAMGATPGEWPRGPRLADAQCRDAEALDDGCWDYHVDSIVEANRGDAGHWSRELRDKLAAARRVSREEL